MCGITGIVNLDGGPVAPLTLRAMTDALLHRGPDGDGIFIAGAAGLGHRRLAIIDLSPAGHQPMVTPDGRYALSYNGEIYNYQTLRAQLEAHGARFHSQTDTEVVLHAFAVWGLGMVDRLNGMFALAILDTEQNRLHLIRDRYGIKPLYYARLGDTFVFASEVKAILAHPAYAPQIDRSALIEYFTFQNLFTDRTLFKDVSLLPAGSYLEVDLKRRVVSPPCRYWDFNFSEPDDAGTEEEYVEELDRLFRQAVTRQLVADVPVGSYLSGGTDSGSVTALAAAEIPDLRTFTVGFDLHSASGLELAFDERAASEHMSYLFKTEHYEMVLKSGDMERAMRRLVWHMEEPRVGQSYPNFYAAQLASKFVKVVLTGTGGDELFGGYPWRYYRAVVNDGFEHYVDKYYAFWQRLIPNAVVNRMFGPITDSTERVWTRDIFRDVFVDGRDRMSSPESYVNHSLYFEARTFLHGLLVVEDKLSMAHSLETRVPFLDNDLVDFAQRVPVGLKLGNLDDVVRLNENEPGPKTQRFFERTRDGKLILRKVMQRHVPPQISEGIKQGFSAPDASWYRGESLDYVRRALLERDALIYEYLDATTVRDLVAEHVNGRANRRLLIWSLLSVEEWCRTFLAGESGAITAA